MDGTSIIMCNVIDDYREEDLSDIWLKIERRIRMLC